MFHRMLDSGLIIAQADPYIPAGCVLYHNYGLEHANDVSGSANAHNGTLVGEGSGIDFVDGGLLFDGTPDTNVTVANHADLIFGTADFQVYVKANLNSTQVQELPTLISKGVLAAGDWRFYFQAVGEVDMAAKAFATGTPDINLAEGSSVERADDITHWYCFVRSGTTARIYVDAGQVAEDTTAGVNLTTTAALQIGQGGSTDSREFTGTIYKVMLCNTTKSFAVVEAELAQLE